MFNYILTVFLLIAGVNTMADSDNLIMELNTGKVVIKFRDDLAPNHVKRIKELVNEKFYDGIVFHRVIDGFMAQTGDPLGNGTGGSGTNIKAEFSDGKHTRGTVSMARSQNPDSGDSQFFICFQDASWLDKQYSIWGEVIDGMEHIDALKRGDNHSGQVDNPDKIIRMYLEKAES